MRWTINPITLRTSVGLFIISLVTLTFELLISRVMSVVAWYHFAFMAICLALFGMTVGAVIVHRWNLFFLKNYHRALSYSCCVFSLSLLLNLVIICYKPALLGKAVYDYFNIVLIFISIAIPLIGSGICFSLIFSQHATKANRVYFINLVGSSLGCLLFIPIIDFFGVINSYLILALSGLMAARFFLSKDDSKFVSHRTFIAFLSLIIFSLVPLNNTFHFLEVKWTKGRLDNKAFYKKWNAFSYLRLTSMGNNTPFGWGFAPKKRETIRHTKIDQIYLDIDSVAGTVMTRFDGDLDKINFLKYDITALPYYLVKNGDILVVGIGAGRDILTGLAFRQKSITGIEINEGILEIHDKLLPGFSGNLSKHPNVSFIHNEARSYINASNKKFDIIQISLIDSFAASLAGAYALTENNLYTVEAFKTYFEHLTDSGFLSVSYWMHYKRPEFMLKLTGIATKALSSEIANPRAHFVIVHKDGRDDNRGVATLLVKKQPFSNEELTLIQNYCKEMGFDLILSPDGAIYDSFEKMSDIKEVDSYARHYKSNIMPAYDDSPFVFLLTKLDIRKFFSHFKLFRFSAEYILLSLLILMIILTSLFVVFPLLRLTNLTQSNISILPFSIYFSLIGLAFMFVEMAQLTRLSAFLGHPIYSLSIVLFSFLLSSGLGSYFLGRIDNQKIIVRYMAVFILICILSTIFTSGVLHYFSRYSISMRMIVSVFMVFPLGFFMGSFLPQGIRLLGQNNGPVAIFWGLNGAMSVLGSILAMIAQITLGLNLTFLLGVVLYLIAIGTLLRIKFNGFGDVVV